MTEKELDEIADAADMIISGYAFKKVDGDIKVVNLNSQTNDVLLMSNDGTVKDTDMDDIELKIVMNLWNKNSEFIDPNTCSDNYKVSTPVPVNKLYAEFCYNLQSLEKTRERKDLSDDFIASGVAWKFRMTVVTAINLMKTIETDYYKTHGLGIGSTNETLSMSLKHGIIEDDIWVDMLKDVGEFEHDYDGSYAVKSVYRIRDDYLPVFEKFRDKAEWYMKALQTMEHKA